MSFQTIKLSEGVKFAEGWITDKDKRDIATRAYKDACYDFYKHLFKTQLVSDFMTDGFHPVALKDPSLKLLAEKAVDRLSQKSPYLFITINPRDTISLEELKKVVQKILKKSSVVSCVYTYEIRNKKDDEFTGLHVHMLVHFTIKPFDFKRGVKNTCKHITDVNNPKILNFVYVNNDKLDSKIEYMRGNKKDSKKTGVTLCKEFREVNNLESIYTYGAPLTGENLSCRGAQVSDISS